MLSASRPAKDPRRSTNAFAALTWTAIHDCLCFYRREARVKLFIAVIVLVWLLWQRFLYRQLMYAVLLKSLKTAITGIRAGWGKLDRKATAEVGP